jgi:hypothetical protein
LCSTCVEPTGVDGGAVAVLSGRGTSLLLHATDDVARAVEDLQLTMGEGPTLDAVTSGVPVLVPDTRDHTEQSDRWPALLSELADLDVRAMFAFPVRVGEIALGTLDLYRSTPGGLSPEQVGVGVTIGEAVGESLLTPDPRAGGGLSYPMTVHRAAGMVMVQLDTTIDSALVQLRAAAFEAGVNVTTVAAEVLDGNRRFTEERP